jgi:hypothetical protein
VPPDSRCSPTEGAASLGKSKPQRRSVPAARLHHQRPYHPKQTPGRAAWLDGHIVGDPIQGSSSALPEVSV